MKKRRLTGYLVYPDGKYHKWTPKYLELKPLDKDLADIFDKCDVDAKGGLIKNKLNKLMDSMRKDIGEDSEKLKTMLEWYTKNSDSLSDIGRRLKGKFTLKKEFRDMHRLDEKEFIEFEKMLTNYIKDQDEEKNGII